jgi:UDP-3-O-[3-hydroxymyristoyl] glucosamine N-acyltransferase
VHIAHNVDVGAGCFFAAQVGIAGSSTIGEGCEFGGQSGMIGHIEVGDRTQVAAKSAIMRSFDGQQILMGIPADDARHMRKIFGIMSQLPELRERIRDLEQQLKQQTDSSTSS